MKKLMPFLTFLLATLALNTSCERNKSSKINTVSQFAYDGLSTYYLWNNQMPAKGPTSDDLDPKKYFQNLLYSTDKEHGWSWITDDVQGLLADFAGEPLSFGFSLSFAPTPTKGEYIAVVKYVFPNSPAAQAGIRRLNFIGKIDGSPITQSNYSKLFGNNAITTTIFKLSPDGLVQDKEVKITPAKINTDPVLFDTIYTDNQSAKKIGYLFYTDFIPNYNHSLYRVFDRFKQSGVTDLILDLRYNHGGALSAATYLSSFIAPETAVKNTLPFVKLSYNSDINTYFDKMKWSRTDSLGLYEKTEQNPLNANLNLKKVYIIATDDSYSASELTTFCLKSYMDVVHVGDTTGGKYTASWTILPYDTEYNHVYDEKKLNSTQKAELKNWGMQPIVAKYTNKDNIDFSTPGYLLPNHLIKEGFGFIDSWTKIGDTKDVLLGESLFLITGNTLYKPTPPSAGRKAPQRVKASPAINIKLSNPKDIKREAVILDNVKHHPASFREIME